MQMQCYPTALTDALSDGTRTVDRSFPAPFLQIGVVTDTLNF